MKKAIVSILGFPLSIFLLINSYIVFQRYLTPYTRALDPSEWLTSSIVTGSTGIILLIWTVLILKKKA